MTASLLMVAVALPKFASAQGVTLWRVGTPYGAVSIGMNPSPDSGLQPSDMIFGHLPSPGRSAAEVAIAQAVLQQGDAVSLPVYSDGTSASENEVFWTADVWRADFSETCVPWPYYGGSDACHVVFSGRVLTQTGGQINTVGQGQCTWPFRSMQVLVTAIAVRQATPTSTTKHSWGSVKASCR